MKHGGDIYSEPIKYDFSVNLNPLDCSEVIEQIVDNCRDKLSNYPDLFQREFRTSIAIAEGIAPEEVIGGNGATELLMSLITMMKPKKVMLLNPCFSGYRHVLGSLDNCDIVEYHLLKENEYIPDEIFTGVFEYEAQNGLELLILTNPNNPTGRNIPEKILKSILRIGQEYGVKIISDECFIKMSDNGHSFVPYINEYSGLYVLNAFTKLFAIPGVRVGYVISNRANITKLSTYIPEWNLSVIAQEAGIICSRYLKDYDWEDKTRREIKKERAYLTEELRKLGFVVHESDTAFILLHSEDDICTYLRSRGILIRDCSDYSGLGKGFYRVTVKNHNENEILIQELKMRK